MNWIESTAKFSDDGLYRYYLRRVWSNDHPHAMCIGLNPSTADANSNDTTIRNLIIMMDRLGYGGFYMVNLFALITSKPDKLRECPDPVKDNDQYLEAIRTEVRDVIFCWGAFKQAVYRAKKITPMFPGALCFGKDSKGNPIHPLAATIWMKSKCSLQPYIAINSKILS